MSLGRAVWTGGRETLHDRVAIDRELPTADSSSRSSSAASNADLQSTLLDAGQIEGTEPATPTGLTKAQVGTLGSFGIVAKILDDEAQRRLGHALSRLDTMASCDEGDAGTCEAMGPGAYSYTTAENVGGDQAVVLEEEGEYKLTIWTETDPITGQQTRHLLYEDADGTYMSGLSSEPVEVTSAPEPELAPEPKAEEGITSFLEGAILGDFSDNTTLSALAGQVAIGFVPYAGQAADIRDLVAAGKAVAEGKENAGWQLALSMVAVFPGVGDAIKAVGKVALGGAALLGTAALKHGDELAELGEGLAKRLADAVPPETLARLSAKLGPDGLEALARGMDAETLARVTTSLDADTLASLVGKGLDGHTVRELADGMSAAELKVLAETGTADEIAATASRLTKERLSGAAGELREAYLKGKPAPYGGNAAAAELTLEDGTRLTSQATSKKAPMDAPRTGAQGADPVTGKGGHYDPTTHADETWVRSPDSEFKILNDLTDQLLATGKQAPTGRLTLYTEMVPCDSCASVLRQFQARFPEIQLQILYDFTSKGVGNDPV